MPAYFVFSLIVSAIERVSVHALARLECDGNAGTCHEQRHHGEEGRARSTGERQLGDVLHVLDLVFIGRLLRSQAPHIRTLELDLTILNDDIELGLEALLEAIRNRGFVDFVGASARPLKVTVPVLSEVAVNEPSTPGTRIVNVAPASGLP
mgnify:CR=1 FL=1